MFALSAGAALDRAAAELGVTVDAARCERVAGEQWQMVLAHTRAGMPLATAFALVMAWYAHGAVETAWLLWWVAVKLAVAVLRVAAAVGARRAADPARWRRLNYALLALDGLVWGVAGWRVMAEALPVAALAAAALACVGSVATFGLQVRSAATAAYTVPMLLPTAAGLLQRGDEAGVVGGVGLLLLQALLLLSSRAAEHRFVAGVLLRDQAVALAREKDEALQLARHQGAVKSQFIARLSHELRTPLHGILGLTQLLRGDAAAASPQARRLELVEASAHHLLTLIDDLLDLSRIDSGRLVLRDEAVELGALVHEVAELHALRAHARGLSFDVAVRLPTPCWVRADGARLRQVLHNLTGNAVKFTARGGVTMTVEREGPGGRLVVTVRDTGPGIAAADLAQMFDAFHQGAPAPGRRAEGIGLGLTIAREIARAMGGDVTATSTPGVGSCFVFATPLADAAAPLPQAAPRLCGALRRLLVAEDDDVNALIVDAYLAELGLDAERVADGRAAVEAALRAGARPDAVLMDCAMPVLDGWAATRAIRDAERERGWPRLPIVALTATAGESDRQRCRDAGMDAVVTKPFTREQLVQALAAVAAVAAAPPS